MGYNGILEANQLPEWGGFYVDYPKLKELLRVVSFILRQHTGDTPPGSGDEAQLSNRLSPYGGVSKKLVAEKTAEFLRELDYNITRAATLYSEELQGCMTRLEAIRTKWPFTSPSSLPGLYQECKDLVERVRDILIFLEINAEAVRRILSKAEKLTQHKLFLSNEILKSRLRPDNSESQFNTLRIHPGTNILMSELRRRLDALRFAEHVWLMSGHISQNYIQRVHQRRNTEALVLQMYSVAKKTAAETKWYYSLANEAEIDYEAQPLGKATNWGLFLNNFNTFLYMTNYYLVIPTAGEYAAALGVSASMSGVLLAMTPFAALFASALYSGWSSRSFRQPLMFCNIVLIFGNIMYSMAYDYKKVWMLFVGRLLVGVGGNRAVNRRYISDFVDMSQKNVQSAIFVAVGSLGMSLGPGIQTIVNYLPTRIVAGFTLNKLTMSSWAMAVMWVVFAFMTMVFFTEPSKRLAVGSSSLLQPLLQGSMQVELPLAVTQDVMNRKRGGLNDDGFDVEGNETIANFAKEKKTKSTTSNFKFVDIAGACVCLWIYFVLKFVQEAFQTAAPLVTAVRFGWTDFQVATLLSIIGLVVLPANLMVGYIGRLLPDRIAQTIAIIGLAAGSCWGLQLRDVPMSYIQYVEAGLCLFVSAQMLEAINMGLLSKVMPKIFATGLWNSGFLSTEAGTLGRMVGSGLVTVFGLFFGVSALQNAMGLTSLVLIGSALTAVFVEWNALLPVSERMTMNMSDPDTNDIIQCSIMDESAILRPLCTAPSIVQQARNAFMSVGGGGKLDDFFSMSPGSAFQNTQQKQPSRNIAENIFDSVRKFGGGLARRKDPRQLRKKDNQKNKNKNKNYSSSSSSDQGDKNNKNKNNNMSGDFGVHQDSQVGMMRPDLRLDSIESASCEYDEDDSDAHQDEGNRNKSGSSHNMNSDKHLSSLGHSEEEKMSLLKMNTTSYNSEIRSNLSSSQKYSSENSQTQNKSSLKDNNKINKINKINKNNSINSNNSNNSSAIGSNQKHSQESVKEFSENGIQSSSSNIENNKKIKKANKKDKRNMSTTGSGSSDNNSKNEKIIEMSNSSRDESSM